VQFQELAHPRAADVEPRADLRKRQALDGAQAEHLTLALSLDVSAVAGERCQAVAVQLADQLVQLDSAAELGAAEQLADAVLGELLCLVDADLGQAGEDSLAQGQFGDAHGRAGASARHQFVETPRDL
jgi:hypothetical protein